MAAQREVARLISLLITLVLWRGLPGARGNRNAGARWPQNDRHWIVRIE